MKNRQAGGIVSFIIVGVALTGLLVGGLYLSKSQGRSARDTDTTAPQVAAPSENEKNSQNKPKDDETAGQQPSGQAAPNTTGSDSRSSRNAQPAPTEQPSQPSGSSARGRVATTGPSDGLPATGPAETATSVVALAGLTFAGYRYVQTRRQLRDSSRRR